MTAEWDELPTDADGSDCWLCRLGDVHEDHDLRRHRPDRTGAGAAGPVLSTAAGNIVAAMRRNGITRLIVLGNTAVRDPRDHPRLFQRLITGYLGMKKGALMRDHIAQARVVAESGLDWTIVRAARLVEGPRASQYRVGLLDSDTGSVTRGDVAAYMLELAVDRAQLRVMPLVSAP